MSAIETSEALFGEKSLKERFGNLQGRELQSKIFETYMVPWTKSGLKVMMVLVSNLLFAKSKNNTPTP